MAKIKVEVEVTKEAHELAQALVGLVKSTKVALADGFQAGMDLPVIVTSNMMPLMSGVEGAEKLGLESKEDMEAFMNAWMLAGSEIAGEFLKKKEA